MVTKRKQKKRKALKTSQPKPKQTHHRAHHAQQARTAQHGQLAKQPKAKKTRRRTTRANNNGSHQQKVVMTPESKLAMQAITSPFKATDNTAKFPDGHGGDSFSTTDKLRKSENNSVWLKDIKQANEQWMMYSNQFVPREAVNVTSNPYWPIAPIPVTDKGALTSVFKSDQPFAGWNILANNCPVYPCGNDSPVALTDPYVVQQQWTDIEISKVYYFAVPGVQIDCTRGNLGGPLNNYDASPPKGGPPPSTGVIQDPVTADTQSAWQSTHDLELQQVYSMQMSAPMQVYRVIDFTYSLKLRSASEDASVPSLDMLRKTLEDIYPNLSDQEILAKVMAMETTTDDDTRYRCQTIHPIAGVTQWEDFSHSIGRTLYRGENYPLLPLPSNLKDPSAIRDYDVRSVSSRSQSQFSDIHHENKLGDAVQYAASQAADAGPFETIGVSSDFTYYQGHNGVQKLGNKLIVNLATLKMGDQSVSVPDYGDTCTSSSIEFTGGLVEARRTVGFGMKLFSTEAALTANGRISGGELPLGLVTDLLNFQDQQYAHPKANSATPAGPIESMDWTPLPDKMDQWTERIESRMEEYTAYTAVDGCTVRYNTLQTQEQAEYIYTNNDSRLTFVPLQIGFTSDPLNVQSIIVDNPKTIMSRVRAEIPMPYHPACDGSEMVPLIVFAPADPVRINYSDAGGDPSREDGLFFQAVLHCECLSSNQFPMEVEESVYDPNWELYSRICAETQNFPVVVKGHSFGSFMRKAGRVTRTAMKFGARAIEVGEVLLPILGA